MLKFKLTKEEYDKLCEDQNNKKFYEEFYTEKDGSYYLEVDGVVDAAVHKEFRDNNILLLKKEEDLTKEIDTMKERYKVIEDPEVAAAAVKKLAEMKEEDLVAKDKIDELFAQRTERLVRDHETQVAALEKVNGEFDEKYKVLYSRHAQVVIDNELQLLVNEMAKPVENAMQDILSRGRIVFRMDDNFHPVARDKDDNPLFSKDGRNPLSMKEWVEELPTKAPHFFEGTAGSGAGGGAGIGTGKKIGGYTREELMKLQPGERLKVLRKEGIPQNT